MISNCAKHLLCKVQKKHLNKFKMLYVSLSFFFLVIGFSNIYISGVVVPLQVHVIHGRLRMGVFPVWSLWTGLWSDSRRSAWSYKNCWQDTAGEKEAMLTPRPLWHNKNHNNKHCKNQTVDLSWKIWLSDNGRQWKYACRQGRVQYLSHFNHATPSSWEPVPVCNGTCLDLGLVLFCMYMW